MTERVLMLKSVGHVRQKSDLAGSLDSLSELTLMHSANAGSTTRQDLAALGHVTAKLGGVLIVDEGSLINTELANFSALAVLGIVLIESQSCILLIINQNGSSPSPSSSSTKLLEAGALFP